MSHQVLVFVDNPFTNMRQRVQMACGYCRHRKVRCDGGKPACSNCRRLGYQCEYKPIKHGEDQKPRRRSTEGVHVAKRTKGTRDVVVHERTSIGAMNQDACASPALYTSPAESSSVFSYAPSESDSPTIVQNVKAASRPRKRSASASEGSYMATFMVKSEAKLPHSHGELGATEIAHHLLENYWCAVHPHIPILNKSTFRRQLGNSADPPSPLLLNAMYAIASSDSSQPSALQHFDRARALLFMYLDAPRTSTVAALILMSAFEHQQQYSKQVTTVDHYSARMYAVMATRMAFDLDLNKLCEDPVVDHAQKELRKRLWWSLYSIDVLLSWEKEEASTIDEGRFSTPECDVNTNETEIAQNGAMAEFVAQTRFVVILQRLLKHINSERGSVFNPAAIVASFEAQIHDWYCQLPSSVRSVIEDADAESGPAHLNSLHLHMLYQSFIIFLHHVLVQGSSDCSPKCTNAANHVTPLADLLLRGSSAPFRGLVNCASWCLLQAGMIHAHNKIRSHDETVRATASQHYETTVAIFRDFKQDDKLQKLEEEYLKHLNNQSLAYSGSDSHIPSPQLPGHGFDSDADFSRDNNILNITVPPNDLSFQYPEYVQKDDAVHKQADASFYGTLGNISVDRISASEGQPSSLYATPQVSPNVSVEVDPWETSHAMNESLEQLLSPFPVLGKSNDCVLANNYWESPERQSGFVLDSSATSPHQVASPPQMTTPVRRLSLASTKQTSPVAMGYGHADSVSPATINGSPVDSPYSTPPHVADFPSGTADRGTAVTTVYSHMPFASNTSSSPPHVDSSRHDAYGIGAYGLGVCS